MGELNYIGWLAILWIAFNIFVLYVTLKLGKGRKTTVGLLDFILYFWKFPVIFFNEVFSWRLPEWTGVLFWLVPLYIHIIYRYSVFVSDYDGWYFSIGNLVFLWVH